MTETKITELFNLMGLRNITPRGEWVMASCPFASRTHAGGTDKNPSFGVSIGPKSFFNCFSCGSKEILILLPTLLTFYFNRDYSKLTDFIIQNETSVFEDYDTEITRLQKMEVIPGKVLSNYEPVPDSAKVSLNLTDFIIEKFELKYHARENRLVIPIRDELGRFVAMRGRYIGADEFIMNKFKFIPYGGNKFKSHGIWYNMNSKLIKDKPLVLTEGETDVWALLDYGVKNVWGSIGATLTKEQLYTIQQISTPIVLFFDDDLAGMQATNKIIEKIKGLVPVYKVANYHNCNDAKIAYLSGKLPELLNSWVRAV